MLDLSVDLDLTCNLLPLPFSFKGQNVGSLGLAARPSVTSGRTMPPSEEEGRELCPEKPLGGAPTASVLNLVTSLIGLCKSKV